MRDLAQQRTFPSTKLLIVFAAIALAGMAILVTGVALNANTNLQPVAAYAYYGFFAVGDQTLPYELPDEDADFLRDKVPKRCDQHAANENLPLKTHRFQPLIAELRCPDSFSDRSARLDLLTDAINRRKQTGLEKDCLTPGARDRPIDWLKIRNGNGPPVGFTATCRLTC